MAPGKIAVLGVPSAAGGRRPGTARAPQALREAGLLEALRSVAPSVINLSDPALLPYRPDPDNPKARNAAMVARAIRAAADEMARAIKEGFTLVLGGDCSVTAGVAGGAWAALGEPVGLVYLDADADLNTPETTPSGYLNGMALSLALGRGPAEVVSAAGPSPAVRPEHVSLVGFRALDHGERAALGELGLALPAAPARTLGMTVTAALALDGVENHDGPVVVHFDVDVIDPEEMPGKNALTPGSGLLWQEASDLLTALVASPRVVALHIAEFDPDVDDGGHCARRLVELLARAIGRRYRS